jgi:DNA-binding IclR family transcriptional regulator
MSKVSYAPNDRFGENKNRVMHMLSQLDEPATVSEIMNHLGINRAVLDTCLHRMVAAGEVVRVHRGEYMLV